MKTRSSLFTIAALLTAATSHAATVYYQCCNLTVDQTDYTDPAPGGCWQMTWTSPSTHQTAPLDSTMVDFSSDTQLRTYACGANTSYPSNNTFLTFPTTSPDDHYKVVRSYARPYDGICRAQWNYRNDEAPEPQPDSLDPCTSILPVSGGATPFNARHNSILVMHADDPANGGSPLHPVINQPSDSYQTCYPAVGNPNDPRIAIDFEFYNNTTTTVFPLPIYSLGNPPPDYSFTCIGMNPGIAFNDPNGHNVGFFSRIDHVPGLDMPPLQSHAPKQPPPVPATPPWFIPIIVLGFAVTAIGLMRPRGHVG